MSGHNRIRTSHLRQQQARDLRQRMTPAEELLWSHLRDRRLAGLKFRRQHPLGPFVVDFYCAQARLIVEVDGDIHLEQQERDRIRTAHLESQGYRVLRFQNEQVLACIDTVLAAIAAVVPPPLTPFEDEGQ